MVKLVAAAGIVIRLLNGCCRHEGALVGCREADPRRQQSRGYKRLFGSFADRYHSTSVAFQIAPGKVVSDLNSLGLTASGEKPSLLDRVCSAPKETMLAGEKQTPAPFPALRKNGCDCIARWRAFRRSVRRSTLHALSSEAACARDSMSPTYLALVTALVVVPSACSGAAALLIARHCAVGRNHPKAVFAGGLLVGLLLTPLAIVTFGTIGGGFWDEFGLLGGPLVGVVSATAMACASVTALLVGAGLIVWGSATWAAGRRPLRVGRR